MIQVEKARYHPTPEVAKKVVPEKKSQVDKAKHDELEAENKRLRAENGQFREEMKVMATSVAQLTWELHRYKTATRKDFSNVHDIKN